MHLVAAGRTHLLPIETKGRISTRSIAFQDGTALGQSTAWSISFTRGAYNLNEVLDLD
jgi:hypothetical protein